MFSDVPEERSEYHDMYGEINAEMFELKLALTNHHYIKVINILKKYSVDLDKNFYNSGCFHKCYHVIKKFGQGMVEKGKKN